ncbi:MAG: metallophosphoesterase family protein [Candidatus Alcyoniella australis]|nr:metallophosphoesterase family protein [Candidatus Alcyoniella australis]
MSYKKTRLLIALLGIVLLSGLLAAASGCNDNNSDDDDDAAQDDDDISEDDTVDDDDTADDDDEQPPPDCEGTPDYQSSSQIIRGPYLQHVTQNSIRLMWETAEPANTIVKWGPSTTLGWSFCHWDESTHHEVELVDLDLGTNYEYVVRSNGEQSPMHSFATAPAVDSPFKFAVLADSHVVPDIHGIVVDSVIEADPDIVLYAGDLTVDGRNREEFDEGFFIPGAELFAEKPIYALLGNHEKETEYFFELFSYPEPERWYSFSYGNVRFIGLDTNWLHVPGSTQYQWFEQQLAQANEDVEVEWIVVYAHHPAYCEGWGHPGYDGEPGVRHILRPLMEQYGVDLYFSGHAHDYERGEMGGVTHIITGGAGGALDSFQKDWEHIVVYQPFHHFTLVQVQGKTLTIEAQTPEGVLLDHFTLNH